MALTRVRHASMIRSMTAAHDSHAPELTLGWRLRMALEKAGIENNEMARLLGVHRGTITRYTHDQSEMKRGLISQWALICGVPPEWLAGDLFVDPTAETPHPTEAVENQLPRPRRRATDSRDGLAGDTHRYEFASAVCAA